MYEAVITGLGPVAPNGIGKEAFWEAISSGKTGIRRLNHLEDDNCPCQIAGAIPRNWIEAYTEKLPDWLPGSKNCKFSVLAAILALEDAGLTLEDFINRNTAVYMGVSIPDMEIYQNECISHSEGGIINPIAVVSAAPHTPATLIAHMIRNRSKVFTVSTACTSGSVSINFAAESIMRGETDLVIAGGVEAPISSSFMDFFSTAGMVPNGFNDIPHKASRPFDHDSDGGILSEGAGVIILEEKKQAIRRKAQIYASFTGGGMATAMNPSRMKASFFNAMEDALNKANLKLFDIDYISACAPGDKIIDQAETEAIIELFGKQAYSVPISSIKSMIGNPGAAAGPLQVISAALSVDNSFIPPTVNLERPVAGCRLDYVPFKGRMARINKVMINLRGYGGGTCSLIIKKPH